MGQYIFGDPSSKFDWSDWLIIITQHQLSLKNADDFKI